MSRSSYVEGDFKKLDNLVKALNTKKYVDIGILDGNTYINGETVAQVGAINEFGTENIPRRSFILDPLEQKGKDISKKVEESLPKDLADADIDQVLNNIGFAGVEQIQKAFETSGFGVWEPNAPSTVNAKGSSKPLINEGLLRKSISHEVGGK